MKQLFYLAILIVFNFNSFSQVKGEKYFLRLADSVVLSQCTEGFYELLNKNKQYNYQRRVDLSDPRIDLDKASNQKYSKQFQKDFHWVSYGSIKVFDKLINVTDNEVYYSGSNLKLIFIGDSLTKEYGAIPDFKKLEIAYNRFKESNMMSEDSVKKILETKFTMTLHLETNYSISYDLKNDQVIWIASRMKKAKGGKNRDGGRAHLTRDGRIVVESIEMDGETGKIIKQDIEKYDVIIR